MLSKDLLDILCCPKCRAALTYDEAAQTLTCTSCRHVFEIRNGIPIMIHDEGTSQTSTNG